MQTLKTECACYYFVMFMFGIGTLKILIVVHDSLNFVNTNFVKKLLWQKTQPRQTVHFLDSTVINKQPNRSNNNYIHACTL